MFKALLFVALVAMASAIPAPAPEANPAANPEPRPVPVPRALPRPAPQYLYDSAHYYPAAYTGGYVYGASPYVVY